MSVNRKSELMQLLEEADARKDPLAKGARLELYTLMEFNSPDTEDEAAARLEKAVTNVFHVDNMLVTGWTIVAEVHAPKGTEASLATVSWGGQRSQWGRLGALQGALAMEFGGGKL